MYFRIYICLKKQQKYTVNIYVVCYLFGLAGCCNGSFCPFSSSITWLTFLSHPVIYHQQTTKVHVLIMVHKSAAQAFPILEIQRELWRWKKCWQTVKSFKGQPQNWLIYVTWSPASVVVTKCELWEPWHFQRGTLIGSFGKCCNLVTSMLKQGSTGHFSLYEKCTILDLMDLCCMDKNRFFLWNKKCIQGWNKHRCALN